MNKRANPFYPSAPPAAAHAPYTPTAQPAGQAPAQQYNYSAYWAQPQPYQAQAQPQWTPPQPTAPVPAPPAPSADHAALYANYGYGAQHNMNWQAQQAAQVQPQQQQQQQQGIPIPFASAYPAPQPAPPIQHHVAPYVPQQPQYHPSQPGLYNRPAPHPPPVHHAPPPNLPPAKRPRFDGPQVQPRFHPPPAPSGPLNRGGLGPMQQPQAPGPGVNQTPLGGRGGGPGGSFMHGSLGGRNMNMNNGLMRGVGPMRGGPMVNGARVGMRGRGGGGGGGAFGGGTRLGPPPNLPMRGMARGPGPMNRRQHGGAKSQQNQRPSQPNQGRGGKTQAPGRDVNGGQASTAATAGAFAQNGKNEPRRTFNDFKIVGMEIQNLDWHWGTVPGAVVVKSEEHETPAAAASPTVKKESSATEIASELPAVNAASQSASACRIRIYFHNPKIEGDGQVGAGLSNSPTVARTGKRKKAEDDDDMEFESAQRSRQRPPPGLALKQELSFAESGSAEPSLRGSLFGDGDAESSGMRREMSASVAGTEEPEEDWLMAAIAEGSGTGEPDAHGVEHADTPSGEVEHAATDRTAVVDGGVAPDAGDPASTLNGSAALSHDSLPGDTSTSVDADMVEHVASDADLGAAQTSTIASLYGDHSSTHDGAVGAQDGSEKPKDPAPVSLASLSLSSASAASWSKSSSFTSTVASDIDPVDPSGMPSATTQPEAADDASFIAPGLEPSNVTGPEPAHDVPLAYSPSSHLDDVASVADSSLHVDQIGLVDDEPQIGWSRLSIAYEGGTRRLLLDSAIVQKLKIFRAEGRIEIKLVVSKLENGSIQGFLPEVLSDPASLEYSPVPLSEQESDPLIPPFASMTASEAELTVFLDREKPLSAPKWVKSGDLQEWLRSTLGKPAAMGGEDSWIGRIEVVDPDPPPSIHSVLDVWVHSSNVGTQPERQVFVATHMSNVRNVLEVVLRLVRSDRAGPFSPGQEQHSSPLVAAIPLGSSLAKHQTHITLAFLAVFKLAEDQAASAGTLDALTAHIGEIVRCLPQHLLHKSLDNIFKDYKSGKKQAK